MFEVYVKTYTSSGEEGYGVARRQISARNAEEALAKWYKDIEKNKNRLHPEAFNVCKYAYETGIVTVKEI